MIDTHCHLFMMEGEPQAQVDAALSSGLEALVCVGVDRDTSRRSRELADGLRGVFATAGVHPNSAAEFDDATGAEIEELLSDPRVVAVGETGLDRYRMGAPLEEQERVFRAHCSLSREHGKPLVVHVRDAWDDAMRVLADEGVEHVILHCFSGGPEQAAEAARRGYYCSFAGPVTYPKNDELRAAATAVPPGLLLAETDSPFLPPQPVRGQPNAPANLRHTIAALAAARGEALEAIASLTASNARTALSLPA